jgi:hypothetical protein
MKTVKTYEEFLNENVQSKQEAYSKIDDLPKGKIFDDAKNIDQIFKRSKYTWSEVIETFEKNSYDAKPQVVSVKEISITQPNIQSDKVKKMIEDLDSTPDINVVQFKNGEKAIYDGHHRLVAHWALGENRIKVNLVKSKDK